METAGNLLPKILHPLQTDEMSHPPEVAKESSRNSEVVRKQKIWLYSQRWGFVSRGFLCLLFGGLWPGVLLCGDGGFFYVGAVVLPEFPQDSSPFEGDGSQDAWVAPAFGLAAGNVVSHPGTSCVVGGGR